MEKEMATENTVTAAETADMGGKWLPKLAAAQSPLSSQNSSLY
jgi:hypothetical protein